MARNIMVSDEVYEELKKRKGADDSFSGVIKKSLNPPKKTMKELFATSFGKLKGDTEYDEIMPELKKKWKEFDKRIRESA